MDKDSAQGRKAKKGGYASGVLLSGAVVLLALPSAVLAFTARFEPSPNGSANTGLDTLASNEASPRLARPIAIRSLAKGKLYPFTPAESPNRPDRSVTVAVRVDPETAKAISVRGRKALTSPSGEAGELRIAPTAFSLGVSRGYDKFGQDLVPAARRGIGELPELDRFSIAPRGSGDSSRFSPRIVVDEAQPAGRAPRTFAGNGDDRVDVGGSYRVTRNLDVTAGVRYSQERERLVPPITDGQQDNQAVYVGTQFRF